MLNLMFVTETDIYNVEFSRLGDNVVQMIGDFPHNTTGFTLSRIGKDDKWDYTEFVTVYREIDGGCQYSNDESVYVAPPEPEPYIPPEPTLEEVKMQKVSDAYVGKQDIWNQGFKVVTENGIENFQLTEQERDYIPTLQNQYDSGADKIAFYSLGSNGWIFYSRDDMASILNAMNNLVLQENAYCEDFVKWVNALETIEEVEARYYGESLPDEYKSEVTIAIELGTI